MCFSLGWFEHVLILAVIIVAAVLFVKIVASAVMGAIGIPMAGWVIEALKIVFWAVVIIAVIVLAFDFLSCLRLSP